MTAGEIAVCILSSSVAAATITAMKDFILYKNKKKDDEDKEEDKEAAELIACREYQKVLDEKLNSLITTLQEHITSQDALSSDIIKSNKLLMQERIRFIATRCIKEGEISYETRKLLHDMWDEYHHAWKGNGDLNLLMITVDDLPLKLK